MCILYVVGSAFALPIYACLTHEDPENNEESFREAFIRMRKSIILKFALAALIFCVAIPNKNTMYTMTAVSFLETASKMEEVQKLGGKIGILAESAIDLLTRKIDELK